MATFHKYVMLNPICVVFPLVGTQSNIEDGTLRENILQLEAINCSASYLASTLYVWLASILNVPLKTALSDIMKILVTVIVSFNLIQGFWLCLKIPFLVKNKAKVGQMNC